jgi:hypothetical protein
LMVALLCNLVQDEGGKGGHDRLGPTSTACLIFVVFASTLAYFGMTVQATVRGSLKTKGVVGKLANGMARCCRIEPEKGEGAHRGEDRSLSLARVVPVHQEEQDRRQTSTLKKEIAALKWQKNIRQTLVKNNKGLKTSNSLGRVKSKRTRTVEAIQQNHQNHRELALKNIEQQHSQRRSSLQLRLQARKTKKEGEEKVTEGVVLRGNEMVGKVVVNGGGGGGGGSGASTVKSTHADADATLAMLDKPDKPDKMEEQMKARVEKIRVILNQLMKTQSRLQKWMVRCDTTSNGLLGRADFMQVVKKVVKRIGKEGQRESLMEGIWASVKEGSVEGVGREVVEHEVVRLWVFPGVE